MIFPSGIPPGVAAPCREIAQHPERVYDLTNQRQLDRRG